MQHDISIQRITRHHGPVVKDLLAECLAKGVTAQIRLKTETDVKGKRKELLKDAKAMIEVEAVY